MPSVLLHICCAHCAAYCVGHWQAKGYEVTGWWYNPNIHPQLEHQKRLEAVRTLAGSLGFRLIESPGYDAVRYFEVVRLGEGPRCRQCFRLRLGSAAGTAKEKGFDAFSSTLLISPQQKHELIIEEGETAASDNGVKFLCEDLRKRYSDSRHITKPMAIYRQHYCGCAFSELESYIEK